MKFFNFSESWLVNIMLGAVVFLFLCAIATLTSFVLMTAWNYSIPHLFGLPEMDMLNSLGLLVTTSILGFVFRSRIVVNKK